jgi:GNAT superfamily N-acetyltransferase
VTSFRIETLNLQHDVEGFDCGQEALNRYLHRYALTNQRANAARTYLGFGDESLVGYYTLAVGAVAHADAALRLTKGMARHPVPVMILARLAVDRRWQKQGIGSGLLKDAMRRTTQAAEIAGIRALIVHAKDESAREFYERFGFAPSPTDPFHLYLLTKELV